MHPLRLAVALTGACAAAAALPLPTASAAKLDYTAGSGPDPGYYVLYSASKGEANRLKVTGGKGTLTFTDSGAKRITRAKDSFKECKVRGRRRVVCKIDPRTDLDIRLGDRNDRLSFAGRGNTTRYGHTEHDDASRPTRFLPIYRNLQGANEQHLIANGGAGNDRLRGTRYHDVLIGGRGRDNVDSGGGRDRLLITADGANDTLVGGTGLDEVDGLGSTPLTINLGTETVTAGSETDSVKSAEVALGGEGADTLTGSSDRDGLFGDGGNDTVDGAEGDDYVAGDWVIAIGGGNDKLTGGAGSDILDGREGPPSGSAGHNAWKADELNCGDGADRVIARVDDTVDAACEASAYGDFDAGFEPDISFARFDADSTLWPVRRGADGAPTYSLACPQPGEDAEDKRSCKGRLQLEEPPIDGTPADTAPVVLGSANFDIPRGGRQEVTPVLNDAGKAKLGQPGARVSVHVLVGSEAGPSTDPVPFDIEANFGWQQVLP